MQFKRGLLPPRPGAVKMKFGDYVKPSFPKRPDEFGHESLVSEWHMLSNDKFGSCAWAGAAHEVYLWTAMGSQRVHITSADVLSDYGACTGFNPADPSTDQGTDMQAAASYRRTVGTRDANGNRHKIGAYVSLKAGNLDEILNAAWMFGAVGIGVTIGSNQDQQFEFGKPWDGAPGNNSGGHYIPVVAYRNGLVYVVTWGRLQAVTPAFIETYCDQAMAYLSTDMLRDGKSLDGFDLAALSDDLNLLTA